MKAVPAEHSIWLQLLPLIQRTLLRRSSISNLTVLCYKTRPLQPASTEQKKQKKQKKK